MSPGRQLPIRRSRVLTFLTATVPELTQAAAAAALQEARADCGTSLRRLDEHLATHPDALTSGHSLCPVAVVRLAHALRAAGCSGVIVPGCSECGRSDVELPRNGPRGRVCQACAARVIKGSCSRCGRNARIAARRKDGGICYSCYASDPGVVEECSRCGRWRMPAARLEDGRPICGHCSRPVHVCAGCGQQRPAAYVSGDRRYCGSCYTRELQPRRQCSRCGEERRIAKRATAGSPELCEACNRPQELCSGCGRARFCWRSGPGGSWMCRTCRPLPKHPCSRCGRLRHVDARWPMGPVCSSCYRIILDYPKRCDRCQNIRPLLARDQDGTAVCGPCAGFDDLAYNCARCGRSGELFADRACARCVLSDRLHDLLSGPDGQVSRQLQPVLAGFAKTERARGIIFWLSRSPNAALLARLASTGKELTHELLDELPFNRNLHYVREVLVHTGVLPERNEDLERIPHWLDTLLACRPQHYARLIRPFAHWFLLRRARRRANERRYPAESGPVLRARIRIALEFLAWLDEHDLELATLTQDRLDSWLVATGRRGRDICYFLKWAHGRRIAPKLHIPKVNQGDPYHFLDEDTRWSQLNRCLNDEEMPLDVRCAGALLLLYGLPAVRIRHLRAEQLYHRDGNSYLDLGPRPLIIPPKLARLLHRLAESPNTNQARLVAPGSSRWLFPGLVPGRPAGPTTFSHKLPEHGIHALPARNAALAALASDIPPPILADILGLHINTAAHWAKVTKRDWTDYLTTRAEDLQRRNTAALE